MVAKYYFRLIKLIVLTLLIFSPTTTLISNNMNKFDISLEEAFDLYNKKEILIVDIRTETEWQMTGVIPNSELINMHDNQHNERADFLKEIQILLNKNNDYNVSFICASGARSEIVAKYFFDKGYKTISHIPDGIVGKNYNGWLYSDLPIISYKND